MESVWFWLSVTSSCAILQPSSCSSEKWAQCSLKSAWWFLCGGKRAGNARADQEGKCPWYCTRICRFILMQNWKETLMETKSWIVLFGNTAIFKDSSGFQDTWQHLDKSNWIPSDFRAAQGRRSCHNRPWQMPLFDTTGLWRIVCHYLALLFHYRKLLNLNDVTFWMSMTEVIEKRRRASRRGNNQFHTPQRDLCPLQIITSLADHIQS